MSRSLPCRQIPRTSVETPRRSVSRPDFKLARSPEFGVQALACVAAAQKAELQTCCPVRRYSKPQSQPKRPLLSELQELFLALCRLDGRLSSGSIPNFQGGRL